MSSRQQRIQARRNGAKAAGSKSPAGIQKSATNSLKHGLTSKAIVLSNESQAIFEDLHAAYVLEFLPQSTVEMDLVDQMVAAQWRLRRIWRMQTCALDLKMDMQEAELAKKYQQIDQPTRATVALAALANEERTLDLLLRYESAHTRAHQRAINSLFKMRNEKLRNDPPPTAAPPCEPVPKSKVQPLPPISEAKEAPEPIRTSQPGYESNNPPTPIATDMPTPMPEITHETPH